MKKNTITQPNLPLQKFLNHLKKLELTDSGQLTDQPHQLTLTTIHPETTIITKLYEYFEQNKIHITSYTMTTNMIQDEDQNFITTIIIRFLDWN